MTASELDEEILQFIEHGSQGDEAFNDLALKVFAYQFERNEAYRNFCLKRKRTPETVSHWTEIPPVPTQAFKVLDLACEPTEQAEAIFLSSGTTQGEGKRSKHFIFNLRLYETSVLKWFEPHLLPERQKDANRSPVPTAGRVADFIAGTHAGNRDERMGGNRARAEKRVVHTRQ
jgi:hypothetical protein